MFDKPVKTPIFSSIFLGFLIGFLVGGSILHEANSAVIGTPPPMPELPVTAQHYFKEISDNFNKLDVLTATPNGVRNGTDGQIVIFNDGGTYKLMVNVGTGQVWQQL